jgi:hypothetical protein
MNQDAIILTVALNGTIRSLWTEEVPLHELGRLEIHRACSIEFDNKVQAWRVFDLDGDCLYWSPSKETCLRWEQKHMNRVLENS